jgi:hypothetical protein
MLLAFGLTDSAFRRLPPHERREMTAWWTWRTERQRQLQQKAQAEQQARARLGGRGVG